MKLQCLDHKGSTPNTFLCKINQHTVLINCPLETRTISKPESSSPVEPTTHDLASILATFSTQGKRTMDTQYSLLQTSMNHCDHLSVFRTPDFSLINLDSIDLVLIANSQCMLGLPYLTEYLGYQGRIIATEPTIEYAKQRMEELVIYHGQTATQTEPSSSTHFSQLGDMFQQAIPEGWRSIYTSKDIVSCIEKIQPVRYTETLSLFSTLNVIPYSSGYSLGSANWLLETSFKRIAFLSTSSVYTHLHPAPFDDDILKDTDVVVVAGLTQPSEKDASFERAKSRLLVQLARTIQSLHNVVLVCPASGILFDLIGDIEAYFRSLGKEIGPERHQTPIYVVNPMADQSLKYANICGEWMNSGRHDLLYLPQMPLTHGELMNTGAVQSITSLEAALLSKKTIREPCIVFTGDSACITKGFLSWFLEHWGASELNTCIFIDPDTPHPIQQHIPPQCKMNCIRLPLDTRLKLEDVPSILHTHWQTHASAKHLLLPKMKGSGLIKEQVSDTQVSIYEPGQVIRIDLQRDWERISVSEKLAKSIEPNMMPATVNGISTVWAPIHGTLNYYNNRLEIQPSTSVRDDQLFIHRYTKINTDLNIIIKRFEEHAIPIQITKDINGITTIHLPKDMDAKVIMNGSSTTVVTNNDQVRALLRKMTVIE